MNGFTPGPWFLVERTIDRPWLQGGPESIGWIEGADHNRIVADLPDYKHPGSDGRDEANGRLVAAAPELLAFAQAFEAAGMDSVGGIDVHELICKATGEQA